MTGSILVICKGETVKAYRGALWFYCSKCGARLAWLVWDESGD